MTWTDEKAARMDRLLKKKEQDELTTEEFCELRDLRAEVHDAFMELLMKRAEAGWPESFLPEYEI